ncbi:hypothetical protein CGZ75_06530 [Paenibacillus herberti]|uniref:Uncharacterized protein n=1 Tax=Paenibacillus herberti TaxID=1619309 RepID=A0A229P222_9BACL|nr:hypothetical protein CGZ75_06530 [Paenibacillus herberti]
MNSSDWNEFKDVGGSLADWLENVSLTKTESEEILIRILESDNVRDDFRLSRQIARINRAVAFANRASVPYSERHQLGYRTC